MTNKKSIIWIAGFVGGILLLWGGWWVIAESNKPLPGKEVKDLGREHITDITNVTYNSNPPTSGKHFPIWAKSGAYPYELSDGYVIHSLEHGYIVISYNCEMTNSKLKTQNSKIIPQVFAHEEDLAPIDPSASISGKPLMLMKATAPFTPVNPPSMETQLPEAFLTKECNDLVSQLSVFLQSFQRIVIVPRHNLLSRIALTAWGRIDTLNDFDKKRIETFIQAFHNKGPEQTME